MLGYFGVFIAPIVAFFMLGSLVHAQDSEVSPLSVLPALSSDVAGDVAGRSTSDIRIEGFDDWVLRCVVASGARIAADEPVSCEISQPLMVNQDGVPIEVLNLAVSRAIDKAGKVNWALVVLTPLDVHLASDFGYGVGNHQPELARYRNCNHAGCFVVVALDNERINQLKQAANGAAFFRLLNGQAVKVSFSLKGFTKAFNALSEGQVSASRQDKQAATAGVTTSSDKASSDKEGDGN